MRAAQAYRGVQVCLADDEPPSVRIAPYHLLLQLHFRARVAFLGTRDPAIGDNFFHSIIAAFAPITSAGRQAGETAGEALAYFEFHLRKRLSPRFVGRGLDFTASMSISPTIRNAAFLTSRPSIDGSGTAPTIASKWTPIATSVPETSQPA